jgi:hypothetical protein
MLVYIDRKVIETDVCEVVEDNSSYNSTGYFYGAVKYKAPNGFEFVVNRSKFSNVLNKVYISEDFPYPLNVDCSALDLKEEPLGLGKCLERIEEIEDEIVSFEEELEEIREKGEELERIEEIEDEIASLQYDLEEIREESEELEEELKEFDSIIPKNARLIVEVDNINFGASSMSDFNFWSAEIYEYKGSYFIRENISGEKRVGEINIEELELFLLYAYDNFGYINCLEYMVENRELFKDIEFII